MLLFLFVLPVWSFFLWSYRYLFRNCYALALLSTNIGNMLDSVKTEMHESIDAGKYDVAELSSFCNNIETLNNQIELCMSSLIQQSPNAKLAVETEPTIQKKVDYGKYQVDHTKAHFLTEDFENKKVCGICLLDKYYTVGSWQDALITVCAVLKERNPAILNSFLNDEDFKGKKNSYFLADYIPRKSKPIPGTDIYAWVNLNANMICKVIGKVMKKYDINPATLEIFLRADYSELH